MLTAGKSTPATLLAAALQPFARHLTGSPGCTQHAVGAGHDRSLLRVNNLLQASTLNINEFAETEKAVLPNATV